MLVGQAMRQVAPKPSEPSREVPAVIGAFSCPQTAAMSGVIVSYTVLAAVFFCKLEPEGPSLELRLPVCPISLYFTILLSINIVSYKCLRCSVQVIFGLK